MYCNGLIWMCFLRWNVLTHRQPAMQAWQKTLGASANTEQATTATNNKGHAQQQPVQQWEWGADIEFHPLRLRPAEPDEEAQLDGLAPLDGLAHM